MTKDTEKMTFRLLKADEIEMKVKQISEKGSVWLLYKTARTDMDLLDETVGPECWETDYKVVKDNLYCGIGIRTQEVGLHNWTWKWDCGIESRADGDGNEKKGEASDAFKRAGFKWGIGRELYTAPFIWISSDIIPTVANARGGYKLKDAFTSLEVKTIEYDDNRRIKTLVIVDQKGKVIWSHPAQAHKKEETVIKKPVENPQNLTVEQWEEKIRNTQADFDLVTLFQQWKAIFPKETPAYDRLTAASAERRAKGFNI